MALLSTSSSFCAMLLLLTSEAFPTATNRLAFLSSRASSLPISNNDKTSALRSLPTAIDARDHVLETAERLKKIDGVLLVDSTSKKALQDAVKELEAVGTPPTQQELDDNFVGDWTLLCSTATNTAGLDTTKFPFLSTGPIKNVSNLLKRSLVVKQRIRDMDHDGKVDRIDHVLEYQPPAMLKEILDNLPEALQTLNINPLHVTEGKLTLVHKATMETITPIPKTKLGLDSIVFSLAGNSQYLDGSGADLLGINLPFGEFLNSGTFETTYMDDEIRISRGKLGVVDQLRVFARSDMQEFIEAEEDMEEEDVVATVEEEEEEEAVEVEALVTEIVDDMKDAVNEIFEEGGEKTESKQVDEPTEEENESRADDDTTDVDEEESEKNDM